MRVNERRCSSLLFSFSTSSFSMCKTSKRNCQHNRSMCSRHWHWQLGQIEKKRVTLGWQKEEETLDIIPMIYRRYTCHFVEKLCWGINTFFFSLTRPCDKTSLSLDIHLGEMFTFIYAFWSDYYWRAATCSSEIAVLSFDQHDICW